MRTMRTTWFGSATASAIRCDISSDPPQRLGMVIDRRYRLLAQLGSGGMGIVYLAERLTLDRRFAIKILKQELGSRREFVERFLREARAASSIDHPNVIEVVDTGYLPEGTAYYVMEYLTGEDLARTLDACGRLPWPRARHMALQICDALASAHAKGIVHRDLKPENCFRITRRPDHDFIKILDFGIAKLLDDRVATLTNTGELLGTAYYMAPEQALGDSVDHRIDIYALGAMLYQLLTGKVPFAGRNNVEILANLLMRTPEPLHVAAPDADIPPAVEDIVERAMQKEPHWRFQSMTAFADALSRIDDRGEPISLPRPPATVPSPPASAQATVLSPVLRPAVSPPARSDPLEAPSPRSQEPAAAPAERPPEAALIAVAPPSPGPAPVHAAPASAGPAPVHAAPSPGPAPVDAAPASPGPGPAPAAPASPPAVLPPGPATPPSQPAGAPAGPAMQDIAAVQPLAPAPPALDTLESPAPGLARRWAIGIGVVAVLGSTTLLLLRPWTDAPSETLKGIQTPPPPPSTTSGSVPGAGTSSGTPVPSLSGTTDDDGTTSDAPGTTTVGPPEDPTDSTTAEPPPAPLATHADIRVLLMKAEKQVKSRCHSPYGSETVVMKLVIEAATGRIKRRDFMVPHEQGSPLARCISGVLSSTNFPSFAGGNYAAPWTFEIVPKGP